MENIELLKYILIIINVLAGVFTYELIRSKNGIMRILLIAFLISELWEYSRMLIFLLDTGSPVMKDITALALIESFAPKAVAYLAMFIYLFKLNRKSK